MSEPLRQFQRAREDWDEHAQHREGGKWVVNTDKPASLDYINPAFGYHGDSSTGSAYYVLLEDIATARGLLHKIEHLSGKVWFDPDDFIQAAAEALDVRY